MVHYKEHLKLDPPVEGFYDIPKLPAVRFKHLSKQSLLGFNYSTNRSNIEANSDKLIHFFLPDNYIERVWDNLEYYEGLFSLYKGIIQPDFSQYTNMPRAMRIWNYYRNMWLGAYFANKGIKVIPNAQWSDEDSFEYCFDGMPHNSCVCVSSVGCVQNKQAYGIFLSGFSEMIDRIEPSQIILYGVINDKIRDLIGDIPYIHQESDMTRRIQDYNSRKNKSM